MRQTEFAMEPVIGFEENSLEKRITEFKDDKENMEIIENFIDNVLKKAEVEAESKLKLQQAGVAKSSRDNSVLTTIKNGRIVNRARGMMIRIFDAICNCANSAAVPAQRVSSTRSKKN